jgi:FMN phosphatase YigB (HAD superfamily)
MEFPVVDAFIVNCGEGKIGVCCNTLSPESVKNEISSDDVAVIGRLVVNRDGAERMIINCLAHPTIEYLVLFGEEAVSFCPSTNLLLSIMDGFEDGKIKGGRGLAAQYPNISLKILEKFKDNVKVLPIFKNLETKEVVEKYMSWLVGRIDPDLYELLVKIQSKKKIYYDSLRELLVLIETKQRKRFGTIELNVKEFQHLQPPIVLINGENSLVEVPFNVSLVDREILLEVDLLGKGYFLKGSDSFLMAYSLNKFLNSKGVKIKVIDCLLIGAELSRVEVELRSKVKGKGIVRSEIMDWEREEIPLLRNLELKADEMFYYKVGLHGDRVSVQSLANDKDVEVYDYRSNVLLPMIQKLAKENRFTNYEQKVLHCIDVGVEVGRAFIALESGMNYFQDFRNLFKINRDKLPLLVVEGDNFLSTHKEIITELYTKGLTMSHPDAHKGTMRSGCVLGVYRGRKSLEVFPSVYSNGEQTTQEMREAYKEQLMSTGDAGTYTYGERTRKYFGFDQLEKAVEVLKDKGVYVVQRFDYNKDMGAEFVDGKLKTTKDPCLTHDIYFLFSGKLYSFHIARAHNIVNAYPENIFGLHDAYDSYIASRLGLELGDMFMLSNRGNILLLTEEQKARKFIAEVSKGIGDVDRTVGPFEENGEGVVYIQRQMEETVDCRHPCLEVLESYNGEDIIERAANYLKLKGDGHNNPIIGCYDPKKGQLGEKNRLVFLQCNNRGGKLYASAVFLGKKEIEKDLELCNYIATKFKNKLGIELGSVNLFFIPVVKTNKYKVIGFDLDQTLYPKSSEIDEEIQKYIYTKIAEKKGVNVAEAKDLFYEHYPEKSGSKTLLALGFDDGKEIVQEALEKAEIDKFLIPNPKVRELLGSLKENYILDLITGSEERIALKKLQKLGIPLDMFNVVITGEISKSDGTAYEKWLDKYNYDAKSFLYIGDRKSSDVDVPNKFGIDALLVNVKEIDQNLNVKQYKDVLEIKEELL